MTIRQFRLITSVKNDYGNYGNYVKKIPMTKLIMTNFDRRNAETVINSRRSIIVCPDTHFIDYRDLRGFVEKVADRVRKGSCLLLK